MGLSTNTKQPAAKPNKAPRRLRISRLLGPSPPTSIRVIRSKVHTLNVRNGKASSQRMQGRDDRIDHGADRGNDAGPPLQGPERDPPGMRVWVVVVDDAAGIATDAAPSSTTTAKKAGRCRLTRHSRRPVIKLRCAASSAVALRAKTRAMIPDPALVMLWQDHGRGWRLPAVERGTLGSIPAPGVWPSQE